VRYAAATEDDTNPMAGRIPRSLIDERLALTDLGLLQVPIGSTPAG
jgi:hypothetical protein